MRLSLGFGDDARSRYRRASSRSASCGRKSCTIESNPGIPFGVTLVGRLLARLRDVLHEGRPVERERQRPALVQVRHRLEVEREKPRPETGRLDVRVTVTEPLDVARWKAGLREARIELARLEGVQRGRLVLDDPPRELLDLDGVRTAPLLPLR